MTSVMIKYVLGSTYLLDNVKNTIKINTQI